MNNRDDVLLQLVGVGLRLGGQQIFSDISLEIKKHQVVSLIGYNGSGKSSLLQLMLGTISPSSGRVIKKRDIVFGYVPQKLSFVKKNPLTVKDFLVIYNGRGFAKQSVSCSFLYIEGLLGKSMTSLSGGELQRVLVYNALLGKPDLLLLDEPTAGLDVRAQEEFYELIEHIHQEHGISVVLVSHDIHTVYRKSDLVVCLHKGVCCVGSPRDDHFGHEIQELFGSYVVPYLHSHVHDDR